ncbi:MAG: spondin domain-containing protein [Myxococcota bacterium]
MSSAAYAVLLSVFAVGACTSNEIAIVDTATGSTGPTGTTTTSTAPSLPPSDSTGAGTSSGSGSSSSGVPPVWGTTWQSSTTDIEIPDAQFVVTIENRSGTGLMWSPLSPGLWVNHVTGADGLFESGVPDDGEGLEALAERGEPEPLLTAVLGHFGVDQGAVFDTPVGAGVPGPLLPDGDRYEFTLTAEPSTRLSLAMSLVGGNDLIVASAPAGIGLFAGGGQPLGERDVSSSLRVWDVGSEVTQAPGQGPMQALHSGPVDASQPEIPGVHAHDHSTRAVPLGSDFVHIEVLDHPDDRREGTFIVQVTNISLERGTLPTELSPLLWAVHGDTLALFEDGTPASDPLTALAEDGDAGPLDALLAGSPAVEQHAVVTGAGGGGIVPGETLEFEITPTDTASVLSVATMLSETNDAFLGTGPVGDAPNAGIPLFADGMPRDNEAIENDLRAHLAVWDAGTEANEVPGVGLAQGARQAVAGQGAPEVVGPTVHRYADVTNDLAGDLLGGFVSVEVQLQGGSYVITMTNTSATTAFVGTLSPVLWVLHDDAFLLFDPGVAASPGLEALAEDADPTVLLAEVMGLGLMEAGIIDTPPAGLPGPLPPGDVFELVLTPSMPQRFVSLAAMVMPSNDTFAGLQPGGVALLDDAGNPRSAEAVEADIVAQLQAWDAGTEGNQAGAAGRDMAPQQVGDDVGASEGSDLVRQAGDDVRWSLPAAEDLVRVIVSPVR